MVDSFSWTHLMIAHKKEIKQVLQVAPECNDKLTSSVVDPHPGTEGSEPLGRIRTPSFGSD